MTPTPRLRAMTDEVRALYDRNRQRGFASWCNRDYDFVCPSMTTYPFQWFWDSCFHTVVLSHFDLERARIELRSLLANAQPDGFVAHVTFWQRERFEQLLSTYSIAYRTPYLSDCIQPPVLAEALQAAAQGPGGDAFLEEMLPRVRRYFDWLDRMRDPDRDGLIATLQPDESGLDQTPKYDEYIGASGAKLDAFTDAWDRIAGPYAGVERNHEKMFALDIFVVEDALVNAIYAENQRVLGDLLVRAGNPSAGRELKARAAKTTAALVEKCWDAEAGLFFDLAGLAERKLRVNTVSSLVPIVLPDLPRAVVDALVGHISNPAEYAAPYPVPSVAMNEPSYVTPTDETNRLVWRGPTWMNSNWYVARGLRRHGLVDLARRIEDRSAALVEGAGFREFYDPRTGGGFGALDFSWTALALDLLAAHEADA